MPGLLHKSSGKIKPLAGTPINWDHPMAPKTKTGFFLPCNGGGKFPVDLVQNIQWVGITGANSQVGYYRPLGPPGFSNPMSFRMPNTSSTGFGATYIAPTGVSSPNKDCTIAAIFVDYNSSGIDGPRILGQGNDTGVILEPGHGGGTVFNVLYGGIAHYATTIPYTRGHWYFFGVSTKSSGAIADVFVYDYTTSTAYKNSLSLSAFNGPNKFCVGGSGSGNGQGCDADLYWGLLDHYYWGIDGMSKLAQDPWAFMASSIGGGTGGPSSTASYLGKDTSTTGKWMGIYGHDGYYKAGNSLGNSVVETLTPSYMSSIGVAGYSYYTWSVNTVDTRALQNATGGGATAAYLYSGSPYTFTLNITDYNNHKLSIYAVDWDNLSRNETITVKDLATGLLLNSQAVSSFSGGIWHEWSFSGSVVVTVTFVSGTNAVISGLFFDNIPLVSDVAGGGLSDGQNAYYAC
jgi:hypothetical protein